MNWNTSNSENENVNMNTNTENLDNYNVNVNANTYKTPSDTIIDSEDDSTAASEKVNEEK